MAITGTADKVAFFKVGEKVFLKNLEGHLLQGKDRIPGRIFASRYESHDANGHRLINDHLYLMSYPFLFEAEHPHPRLHEAGGRLRSNTAFYCNYSWLEKRILDDLDNWI